MVKKLYARYLRRGPVNFTRFASRNNYFHSSQHPLPEPGYNSIENEILRSALTHVPEHGFSKSALLMGSRDSGYPDISANLFPNAVFSLIKYHLVTQRQQLRQNTDLVKLQGSLGRAASLTEKIRLACITRLRGNKQIINHWPQALAVMSLAENLPESISELGKLSNDIWSLAGDNGTDTSWYSRRAVLSAIYASTELYMTQDQSSDHIETWRFLDRRLTESRVFGNTLGHVTSYFGFTARASFNAIKSKRLHFG
ncbi:ubiquinone biosynthesis protein COQ9 [Geopyxis carbonaria]|nr:ubiquinone biosynthesis protein COQ9 [Geopyxis carbonaria]